MLVHMKCLTINCNLNLIVKKKKKIVETSVVFVEIKSRLFIDYQLTLNYLK